MCVVAGCLMKGLPTVRCRGRSAILTCVLPVCAHKRSDPQSRVCLQQPMPLLISSVQLPDRIALVHAQLAAGWQDVLVAGRVWVPEPGCSRASPSNVSGGWRQRRVAARALAALRPLRPSPTPACRAPKRKAVAPPEQAAEPAAATTAGIDKKTAAKPKAAKRVAKPKAPKPPLGPAWDASMRPPPLPDGTPASHILSWNVAGLRVRCRAMMHPSCPVCS